MARPHLPAGAFARRVVAWSALALACNSGGGGCGHGNPTQPPLPPDTVEAVPGDGQALVTFESFHTTKGFNLYWDTVHPVGVGRAPQKITGVTSPYLVTGLSNQTTYYFVMTGVDAIGQESARSAEVSAIPLAETAFLVFAGGGRTCALSQNPANPGAGVLTSCWGTDGTGALGFAVAEQSDAYPSAQVPPDPRIKGVQYPAEVSLVPLGPATAQELALGSSHTCSIIGGSNTVQCWGDNSAGQLGVNNLTYSISPVAVVGPSSPATLAAGSNHTCEREHQGGLLCWGAGTNGQLGNGATANSSRAVSVVGLSPFAGPIAAGGDETCAIVSSNGIGPVMCWGANDRGQLGNGSSSASSSQPVAVTGITTAVSLAVGGKHACAVLLDGTVRCWGANDQGQLGNGTVADSSTPVFVGGNTAIAIVAGDAHSCVLLDGGRVLCWGHFAGRSPQLVPTDVALGPNVMAFEIVAGAQHTCALVGGGGIECWAAEDSNPSNAFDPEPLGRTCSDPTSCGAPAYVTGFVGTSATAGSLSVSPSQISLGLRGSQQLVATLTNPSGATVDRTSSVIWRSTDRSIADVGSTLLGVFVTGAAVGTTTITATDVANNLVATASVTVAAPQIGIVALVSADASDPRRGGNGPSSNPVMSATGRYVAFDSSSTNLISPAPTQQFGIWLRDTCVGAPPGCTPSTQFLDVDDLGQKLDGTGFVRSIDGDGSVIGLDYGPVNVTFGYLRDACPHQGLSGCPASTSQLLNASGNPVNANFTTVSHNGRYAAFRSLVSGQGGVVTSDIYLRDTCLGTPPNTCTPTLSLVVPGGNTYPSFNTIQAVDAQGDILYQGVTGQLFLVNSGGGFLPNGNPVSVNSQGNAVAATDTGASMSDDARFVSFTAPGTRNGIDRQIYLRDTCTGATSCSPSTILVSESAATAGAEDDSDNTSGPRSMSQDGRYVSFVSSSSDVVSGGTGNTPGGALLGFVRDTCSGASSGTCTPTTHLVSVDSAGNQVPNPGQYDFPISGDGHYVAFAWTGPDAVEQVALGKTGF